MNLDQIKQEAREEMENLARYEACDCASCVTRKTDFVSKLADRLVDEIEKAAVPKLSNIRSGWTRAESGPCCEKCAFVPENQDGRAEALKSLVGCRNPFQLERICSCHLQSRVNSVLEAFTRFKGESHD